MIQIKNLVKTYKTGDFVQKALDGVSLNLRNNEFVAILGPSGSGKTTFLNVVGGLDRYDSGDILIDNTSTKNFDDKMWDAYRNKSVGFVFQSYNLISHLSVLDNIEISMTLAKVNKKERQQRALEVLERVGLKEHAHKRPSQLSGGQMQRVAIARSLVNNPDIILADEPTGALDSTTSVAVLELIREIAKEKLVVMVTHNQDLANRYANRIVEFKDGKIINDTNSYELGSTKKSYQVNKTNMSFLTALKLSFKNILTKKWRTSLTAFASSIGIIGVALILSLSNGFDKQIKEFETSALSNYPLTISKRYMNFQAGENPFESDLEEFSDDKMVYGFDMTEFDAVHINKIDKEYRDYLSKIDPAWVDGFSTSRNLVLNLLSQNDGKTEYLNQLELSTFPTKDGQDISGYLKQYYDLLEGQFPSNKNEMVLILDTRNQVELSVLESLGADENVEFNKLIGKELKVVPNNDFYEEQGPIYTMKEDLDGVYQNENNLELKLVGILRINQDKDIVSLPRGLYYSDQLALDLIDLNQESDIVKAQEEVDYYILNNQPFQESPQGLNEFTKENALVMLGATDEVNQISIYPKDFDSKQNLINYLDAYNENKDQEDKVLALDLAKVITDLTGNIMNGITLVLIAFAAISLIVSMIMIGIIIYISVLERTKEIGILRALGARKKDITRVFNAETFIIGLFSGLLGIGIAYGLTYPINQVIYNAVELPNVAQLNIVHAIILIVIAVILTLIGGFIPSKMAAKKDPVAALRSE